MSALDTQALAAIADQAVKLAFYENRLVRLDPNYEYLHGRFDEMPVLVAFEYTPFERATEFEPGTQEGVELQFVIACGFSLDLCNFTAEQLERWKEEALASVKVAQADAATDRAIASAEARQEMAVL